MLIINKCYCHNNNMHKEMSKNIFKISTKWIDLNCLTTVFLLLFCPTWLQAQDNTTREFQSFDEDYLMKGKFLGHDNENKQPKFITFNTNDEDISIEMTIGVPFITIPMKKSESGTGVAKPLPSVNINTGALAVTFGVTMGALYIAPLVGKIVSKSFFSKNSETTHKDRNSEDPESPSIMDNILRILEDQGIPVQDCIQRAVCTLVKRSLETENPTSSDKIIDGITSNEWLMSQLEGTMISEAIETGKSLTECYSKYSKCKIHHSSLQAMSNMLSNNLFSTKGQSAYQ